MKFLSFRRFIKKLDYNYEYFDDDMEKFVNENSIVSATNYLITTSIANKYTYIFKKNDDGYDLLNRWLCATGKPSEPTPKGVFSVIGRRPNFGSATYQVRYATRFKERYYYHSIVLDGYGEKVIDDRLGVAVSDGCVRLSLDNAKWIYDNVPDGTTVIIK